MATKQMPDNSYRVTSYAVYYGTAAVFGLMTAAPSGEFGQPRFSPVAQAIMLTAFPAVPICRGLWIAELNT
jgi:hypothetical protein